MEEAMQKLAAICFLLIGLSHIVRPRAWAEFFILIREKREAGALINGFIHFPLGALIVAFHNVWGGIFSILTLIGYGLLLKGLICFVFPGVALKSLDRVSLDKAGEFVWAGIVLVGIACLFLYSLFYQ